METTVYGNLKDELLMLKNTTFYKGLKLYLRILLLDFHFKVQDYT